MTKRNNMVISSKLKKIERKKFEKIIGVYFTKKSGLLGIKMSNFCKQRGYPWFFVKLKTR